MELPKEEYIKVEKDGQIYTCCTMRQKALHTIGLNSSYPRIKKRLYTRNGKRYYKPYRNWLKLDTWNLIKKHSMAEKKRHTGLIALVLTGSESNLIYISMMRIFKLKFRIFWLIWIGLKLKGSNCYLRRIVVRIHGSPLKKNWKGDDRNGTRS